MAKKGRLGGAVERFQVDNRKTIGKGMPKGKPPGGTGKSGPTKAEQVAKAAKERKSAGKRADKNKTK